MEQRYASILMALGELQVLVQYCYKLRSTSIEIRNNGQYAVRGLARTRHGDPRLKEFMARHSSRACIHH
jgi:hypothetical protein